MLNILNRPLNHHAIQSSFYLVICCCFLARESDRFKALCFVVSKKEIPTCDWLLTMDRSNKWHGSEKRWQSSPKTTTTDRNCHKSMLVCDRDNSFLFLFGFFVTVTFVPDETSSSQSNETATKRHQTIPWIALSIQTEEDNNPHLLIMRYIATAVNTIPVTQPTTMTVIRKYLGCWVSTDLLGCLLVLFTFWFYK